MTSRGGFGSSQHKHRRRKAPKPPQPPTSDLHPVWTPAFTNAVAPIVKAGQDRDAIRDAFIKLDPQARDALVSIVAAGRVQTIATPIFVVPLLSETFCADLTAKASQWGFAPNLDEGEAYQIPEAVLIEHDQSLDQRVRQAFVQTLGPILTTLHGRMPGRYASLQVARYSPHTTAGGAFHIDHDADVTVVVALNGDFEGGGTIFRDGLLGDVTLPPLPVGSAVIFPGRTTHHMGLPVTAGARFILTAWLHSDGDRW